MFLELATCSPMLSEYNKLIYYIYTEYSLSLDITFITCLTFKHFIVVFEPLQPQGVKFSVKFLYSLQIFYVADFNTYVWRTQTSELAFIRYTIYTNAIT